MPKEKARPEALPLASAKGESFETWDWAGSTNRRDVPPALP